MNSDSKMVRVNFDVTRSEHTALKVFAARYGKSISEIFRNLIGPLTVGVGTESIVATPPAKPKATPPKPSARITRVVTRSTGRERPEDPLPGIRMLCQGEVLKRRARGKTSHWNDIRTGLFTNPIKIGERNNSWPEAEVDALIKARIAGKTDDQMRSLVSKLERDRLRLM